jgi:hypothetical protein
MNTFFKSATDRRLHSFPKFLWKFRDKTGIRIDERVKILLKNSVHIFYFIPNDVSNPVMEAAVSKLKVLYKSVFYYAVIAYVRRKSLFICVLIHKGNKSVTA